jgi:hypothetical protein
MSISATETMQTAAKPFSPAPGILQREVVQIGPRVFSRSPCSEGWALDFEGTAAKRNAKAAVSC